MKKLYIQPAVEVETMETLDVIAVSLKIEDAITGYTITGTPSEGNGTGETAFGAKGNSLWGFDEDEDFDTDW